MKNTENNTKCCANQHMLIKYDQIAKRDENGTYFVWQCVKCGALSHWYENPPNAYRRDG